MDLKAAVEGFHREGLLRVVRRLKEDPRGKELLFELVDARRNAFAEGEGPAQICECERVLDGYLAEVKQLLGARAEKLPDTRKARKLLAEVRKQIATIKA